jgi:regulator of protease activity HflC (stomatin/prohibitin superfamily)
MGLLIFGLILFFLSFAASAIGKAVIEDEKDNTGKSIGGIVRYVSLGLIFIGFFVATVRIVPAGQRGVLLRFGAVDGTLSEGIHIITPYVNSLELMEVRTLKEQTNATAASKDLQIVTTAMAINFHVNPSAAGHLYKTVGLQYVQTVVDPAVQESIKQVTAQYTAEELIKQRTVVKNQVELEIKRRLAAYDLIVEPMGVSITNFDFSPDFNTAIESKQVAQQDAEKQHYVLQKAELERQTAVTKAKGEAEAVKIKALSLKTAGGGKVLAREWIDKWDGHLPYMVNSNGSGMMIDISKLINQKEDSSDK